MTVYSPAMPVTTLLERLLEIVGPGHVFADPELSAPFERDIPGRYAGEAQLVVRPADRDQVAAVLAACNEARVPVVTQGGNTGLVGAGVPRGGEVLLSLARLTELGPVDPIAAQVTA